MLSGTKRKNASSAKREKRQKLERREDPMDEEKLPHKKYNHGSIVRVKLHNFVTYDDIEFFPDPGLNLIVGPNGTGKSSVVCALCLGLGGSTSSLGRADSIKDYVKRGKKRGYVEIELHEAMGPGRNCIIKRTIDVQDRTNWYIDERHVRKKDVTELTQKLNIKVNNLCQFLAQERVVNFAKQTPVELLLETEKAVENSELYDYHKELIALRESEKIHNASLEDVDDRLERLRKQQEEAQRDHIRFERREELIKHIKILKKKLPWAKYDHLKEAYKIELKRYKEAKKEYEDSKKDTKPLQTELRKLKNDVKNFDEELTANKTSFRSLDSKRNNCGSQLEGLEEQVEDHKAEIRTFQKQLQERNKIKRDLEAKLGVLMEKWDALDSVEEVEEDMQKCRSEMDKVRANLRSIQRSIVDAAGDIRQLKMNEREALSTLADLNNVKKMRDQKLFATQRNARRMFEWVQSHRDEFKDVVLGPIARECDVKTELHATYLDKHVGFAVKFGYVVSNGDDWNTLQGKAKEFNVVCTIIEAHAVETPSRRGNMQHLRKYGVTAWLDEVVECPQSVKAALFDHTSIHVACVTDRALRPEELNNVLKKEPQDKLGCFLLYTPQENHRVTFSSYGSKARSVGVHSMTPAKFITVGADPQIKKEAEQNVAQIRNELLTAEQEREKLESEQQPLTNKNHALQDEIQKLREIQRKRKSLRAKISNIKDRLSEIQSEVEITHKIVRLIKTIKELNSDRIRRVIEIKELFSEWVRVAMQRDVLVLSRRRAVIQCEEIERLIDQISRLSVGKKAALDAAERSAKEAQRLQRRQKLVAEKEAPMEEFKDVFQNMDEDTVQQIEIAIIKYEAQLDSFAVDPAAVQRYKTREVEIKQLEGKQLKRKHLQQSKRHEIHKIKEKWLPKLQQMIAQISKIYGRFFEGIGCQAKIQLHEDEDFDKYALQILVQFRKNNALKQLSGTAQSGGERSVATMLYLLCLQEVTTCPFRVVDEINQGMDPTNERMIFNQVVGCSSQPNSPQYFMVTPKLLPDLHYSANVTMFVVYNGPWQLPQKHWNVDEIMTQRRSQLR